MKCDPAKTLFIKQRRSIRRFLPKPVPDEVIQDILECARTAPSGHNAQPWLIGAVSDSARKNLIADLVINGRFIGQCAVCFAVFAERVSNYWLEDGCSATMNIITASTLHGIATCWVAGAGKSYGRDVADLLAVPRNYELVSLVAAGYPADSATSTKKPPGEVLFREAFDTEASAGGFSGPRPRKRNLRAVLRHRLRALVLKWL